MATAVETRELFHRAVRTEAAVRARAYCERIKADNTLKKLTLDGEDLFRAFIAIHENIFQDSTQYDDPDSPKTHRIKFLNPEREEAIRAFFRDFSAALSAPALRGDLEATAHVLDSFFQRSREAGFPLQDAHIAMGVLYFQMGLSSDFRPLLPHAFSTMRAEGLAPEIRASPKRSILAAISQEPKKRISSCAPFIEMPGSYVTIAGHRFLIHKVHVAGDPISDQEHLITEDGYLLNLTREGEDSLYRRLEKHLEAGHSPRDFEVQQGDIARHPREGVRLHIADFIEPEDQKHGRERDKGEEIAGRVAGIKASLERMRQEAQGKTQKLFSLEVDQLTGLTLKEVKKLNDLLFQADCGFVHLVWDVLTSKPEKPSWGEVQEGARKWLRDREVRVPEPDQAQYAELCGKIDYPLFAEQLLRITREFMRQLGNTTPVENPHASIMQGGTASGKSGLDQIMEGLCGGKNFLVASLDEGRRVSRNYPLEIACNHHSTDYMPHYEVAETVRILITVLATHEEGNTYQRNIIIDGSGIPWKNRNDLTAKRLTQAGHHVFVLSAASPLFQPSQSFSAGVEGGDITSVDQTISADILFRVGVRLCESFRGVPIAVVVGKNIANALAMLETMQDENLEGFIAEDYAGAKADAKTLAFIAEVDRSTIDALYANAGERFMETVQAHGLLPEYFKPGNGTAANGCPEAVAHYKVLQYNKESDTYRIAVILDLERYIGQIQKGLLNAQAIGPEELDTSTLVFDIAGDYSNKGRVDLLRAPTPPVKFPKFIPVASSHHSLDRQHSVGWGRAAS